MRISFQAPNCCFFADFNQTSTAQEITKRLPIDSKVSLWGDEIYFETGILSIPYAQTTLDVNVGDIALWPDGKCICIFFGPTPFSKDKKPVPASPVIVIGKTSTSPYELKKIQDGQPIRIMPVEEQIVPSASVLSERKLSQTEIDELVKQLLAAQANNKKD